MRRTEFYDKWAKGDEDINMHIQFLVAEKSDTFNIRNDCPPLKVLMDKHESKCAASQAFSLPGEARSLTVASLAYDELQLVLRQADMDLKSLEVWQRSSKSVESTAYHALQQFVLRKDENATHAVDLLMQRRVTFAVWDPEENARNINILMDSRRVFGTRNHMKPELIPYVCLMNHVAPCCYVTDLQTCQMNTMSWCICENTQSLGIVISPNFSNNMNKKYLLEQSMLTRLSKHNFAFDNQVAILFKDKSDKRDNRPMTYHGRIIFPAALGSNVKSVWATSTLVEVGRTDPVPQLSPRDMLVVEDIAEGALPGSGGTENDRYPRGGLKAMQLGVPAWDSVMSTLMSGARLAEVPAVIFVNLTSGVGDEVNSFLKMTMHIQTPMHMVVLSESQVSHDWLESTIKDTWKEEIKEKRVVVPGQLPIETKVPEDEVASYAEMPPFKVLVVNGKPIKRPGSAEQGQCLPEEVKIII